MGPMGSLGWLEAIPKARSDESTSVVIFAKRLSFGRCSVPFRASLYAVSNA